MKNFDMKIWRQRRFLAEKNPQPGRRGKPVMKLHMVNIPKYLAPFRICWGICFVYMRKNKVGRPDNLFRNAYLICRQSCFSSSPISYLSTLIVSHRVILSFIIRYTALKNNWLSNTSITRFLTKFLFNLSLFDQTHIFSSYEWYKWIFEK